jgi:hypothetical protein
MLSLKNVPGIAARACSAVSAFIASRLVQLGLLENEGLDVVAFDGCTSTITTSNPQEG